MIHFTAGDVSFGVVSGGLNTLNTLTPTQGSFTNSIDVDLKLKPNKLAGGVYYRFKLSVTDEEGTVASAVHDIRMNNVPTEGMGFCLHCLRAHENRH